MYQDCCHAHSLQEPSHQVHRCQSTSSYPSPLRTCVEGGGIRQKCSLNNGRDLTDSFPKFPRDQTPLFSLPVVESRTDLEVMMCVVWCVGTNSTAATVAAVNLILPLLCNLFVDVGKHTNFRATLGSQYMILRYFPIRRIYCHNPLVPFLLWRNPSEIEFRSLPSCRDLLVWRSHSSAYTTTHLLSSPLPRSRRFD